MSFNDVDDFNEKIFIGNIVKKQTKYGSFCNNHLKEVRYIKHNLETNDTLQGLALRYNVSMEMIKRANNLWTSDSLFSRSSINIPIECSKRVDSVQPIQSHDSTLACHEISLEDNCKEESEKTKGEKESDYQTSLLHDSERNGHFNNPEESLTDFLLRIDNHIAHSKHSVNTITQSKKELHTTYSDDDLIKRKNKSSSSYVRRQNSAKVNPFSNPSLAEREEDLPQTLFINHGRKVKSSLKKLEKEQDEIYQL